jgi:hypothetical protein
MAHPEKANVTSGKTASLSPPQPHRGGIAKAKKIEVTIDLPESR